MAAKETLTIEVLTQQAQKNVDALNKSLGGLKSALAGLAIGALIRNVMNFADSIEDVAKVTGIANAELIGFANTVAANGGTFDSALQAATRFSNTLGELYNGSKAANDAFRQLGFTTEEIINSDTTQIFDKVIERLGELEKKNAQLAQTVKRDIFSKTLDTTSLDNVSESYKSAVREAQNYVAAQQAVARLQDKLDQSFVKLQFSILKALEPLAEKIAALPQEKIDQLIESFIELAKSIGSLAVAFKVFSGIGSAVAGILGYLALAKQGVKVLGDTVGAGETRIKGFQRAWASATSILGKVWEVIRHIGFQLKTLFYFLAGFARFIPLIAAVSAAFYALNEAIKFAFDIDLIDEFINYVKKAAQAVTDFLGITSQAKRDEADATKKAAEEAKKQADKEKEKAKIALENLQIMEDYKKNLASVVADVRKQNKEYLNQIQFNKDILNLSDDQKEVEVAKRDAIQNSIKAVENLRQQQNELKTSTGQWLDVLGPQKYKEIELAINRILAGNAGLKKAAEENVLLQQKQRDEADKQAHAVEMLAEKFKFDEAGQQLTENLSLIGLSKQALDDATRAIEHQRQVRQVQYDFEVKLLELQQKQAQLGDENFKRELDQLQKLTAARLQTLQAQYDGEEKLANANTPTTWLEGWKTAYRDFVNTIPTVAEQGKMAFDTFTKGLTDVFVNFAKTGKLSFKDLINNIIAQIVQSKIQQMIASIFNPMTSGGSGIMGFFSKIFGFAEGGEPPVNKPSLVGEKGPELFVPKVKGTIIPNDVLENIKELNKLKIQGFAQGGMPPVGKPSLVGEKGAELFVPQNYKPANNQLQAPQNITNNYITNQISALDSKSVAQLFAENRKTLLGTVQMAQKELPR